MSARILVIDDQPDSVDLFKLVLKTYLKNVEVRCATEPEAGVEEAFRDPPDAIILDVKMPGMNGFEVCRKLKETPATRDVPVLLVSGVLTDSAHRARGYDAGAEGYLPKPFEPQEFISKTRALLRLKESRDEVVRRERALEEELRRRTADLQASEEQFRSLFERSPDPIFIEDASGRVLDANLAACRLHCMTREELVGGSILDLVPERMRDQVQTVFPHWFSGAMRSCESVSRTKDGHEVPVELHGRVIPWRDGEALLLHARDITDRRHIEAELRRSESGYRTLVESLPAGLLILQRGHIVFANQPAADQVGLPLSAALLGREFHGFLNPECRERFARILEQPGVPDAGGPFVCETVLRRADDADMPVELYVHPILYHGQPAIQVISFDIRRRAQAMVQAREAEQRYRMLVEQLPAITYIMDLVLPPRTIYISPQVQTMLGFTPEECCADPQVWIRQVHPDDRERLLAGLAEHDRTHLPFVFEYRMLRRTGEARWVRNQGVYVEEKPGRWMVHGVIFDFTEQQAADAALRQSEDLLRQSQKMEALGRLSGGVAHDFNNLLTTILGYGTLLREHPSLPDALKGDLDEILRAGERASTLTRQLLAFTYRQSAELKPTELNAVLGEMNKLLRRTLGEDIELDIHLDSSPCRVMAAAGQMEQVIMNLALNARQAMPRGGRLTIRTSRRTPGGKPAVRGPEIVRFEVADTGCGMTAEVREHAFEPFFTTRAQGEGTGLGLFIVYGIVKQLGGEIELDTAPGRGARFRMDLPAASAEPSPDGTHSVPASLPRGRETILLVEDEPAVRRLAVRVLRDLGYRLVEADQGEAGWKAFQERPDEFDLVLSDVVMPVMGGYDMAARIRGLRPAARMVFMSGFSRTGVGGEPPPGTETIPILTKPFTQEELAVQVRRALDTSAVAPAS